ncbi:MAG: carbamoyl-phosphate synthase subunit L, partial [Bacteroidota bacterium]
YGLGADGKDLFDIEKLSDSQKEDWKNRIRDKLQTPKPDNIFYFRYALQLGYSLDELYNMTKIDRWFLYNIKQIVDLEEELKQYVSV